MVVQRIFGLACTNLLFMSKNQEFLTRSHQLRKILVDREFNKTKKDFHQHHHLKPPVTKGQEESSSCKERKIASQELESFERGHNEVTFTITPSLSFFVSRTVLNRKQSLTASILKYFEYNKMQNWSQRQFHRQMSHDYDCQDSGFAATVAATALAIYSLEEQEAENQRRMIEELEMSKIRNGARQVDLTTGSRRVTRRLSSMEINDADKASSRRQMEQEQRMKEGTLPIRKPGRSLSMRNSADQRQKGNSTRRDIAETKAESWEKTRLQKLNKRYDKLKSDVLAWENAKKMRAQLNMERKENELEMRRMTNLQHYRNKLARIDLIAGEARRQLEEKRINEESELKEKAKYMESKGRSPINCFCC